jgi:hypothetical protein
VTTPEQRAERRRTVVTLIDQGVSTREICRRLSIGKGTLYRDLHAAGRPRPANVPAAPVGNVRALRSGAYSERQLAPVRQRHADDLARRYPWVDVGRRAVQAQRLGQIELGARWLDERGEVVRDDEGRIYPIADAVSKWSTAAERWFERAEEERREIHRHDALAEVMNESEEAADAAA